MNVFCVRPKRFNVGNETINFAVRALLRRSLPSPLNLVPIPAITSEEDGSSSGLTARTVHEMNQYGQGVVVGGGNLYENGQLDVDLNALACLRPPLLLFSLSYGRIYDERRHLIRRTDSMPDEVIAALHRTALLSLARDGATLEHLRSLGLTDAVLGGCPTLLLDELLPRTEGSIPADSAPVLVSVRNPQLMSVPLADQARVYGDIRLMIKALRAEGIGPVRLLCHDKRDLAFASSFGDVPYILPDDVLEYLELLRAAQAVISFRLHAFLPCLSFGTHAVNISYDERSSSLVRTLGLEDWNVDFLRDPDVVATVIDRVRRPSDLAALVRAARPAWDELKRRTNDGIATFAAAVEAYTASPGTAP